MEIFALEMHKIYFSKPAGSDIARVSLTSIIRIYYQTLEQTKDNAHQPLKNSSLIKFENDLVKFSLGYAIKRIWKHQCTAVDNKQK